MRDRDGRLLVVVAERLRARTDDLIERQLRVLRTQRAYDQVPNDDLRRSCKRNVMRVVAALEQRNHLPPEIEEDERTSGQRRALQGVAAEDVVEAYRAVLAELRDAFIEETEAVDGDPRAVLAGTRLLWDLTDRFSNVLVSARQQVEIDAARVDERHRIGFLQRLLVGGVEHDELTDGGAVFGVLPHHTYWVLRGRHHSEDVQQLARHLESVAAGPRPLMALIDGDVAGISSMRPGSLDTALVAVAGPVPPTDVPHAFAEATRVLNVALRYGRTGVVDSSSLSVRMAVEQHAELGEQLYLRYVQRLLRGGGTSEELLHTLMVYLRKRRSVAATARELMVHENTVRYRLDRYQTLTGADLADADMFVEVWWALEYASIRQSPIDSAPMA